MDDAFDPRSLPFRDHDHPRFWWHHLASTDYIPPVLAGLSADEWTAMREWFADTEKSFAEAGEISIPGISMLHGLIGGNGIERIVQLGHYTGYSTLLLGFLLRSMKKRHALFSVDIVRMLSDYTGFWVNRAGLEDVVRLVTSDSASPEIPAEAIAWLGGPPQLVFIDSSHQYKHTLAELNLWYNSLVPGGFIAMHDGSAFAQSFDVSSLGGVLRAATEWTRAKGLVLFVLNESFDGSQPAGDLTYRDRCGLVLIQKPMPRWVARTEG